MNTKFSIDPSSIVNVLTKKELLIPVYQRKYSWKNEHVEALIDDLQSRERDGSEHYFGVIALSSITTSENGQDRVISKVIDGQQRLTTSLILLTYLSRNSKVKNDEKILKILDYKSSNLKFSHEISESSLGSNIQHLISGNYNFLKGQFKNTYEVINERLKGYSPDYLGRLFDCFRQKFIIATLNYNIDQSEEMLVFENLNSKGSPLKAFDLIRNHIISLYKGDAKESLKLFNQNIWNLTQTTYKFNSDDKAEKSLERFIELFSIFKKNGKLEKYAIYGIYKNFKYIYCDPMDNKKFDEFLYELRKYAILYLNIIQEKDIGKNIWIQTLSKNKDNHISFLFHLFSLYGEYDSQNEKWILNETIENYLKVTASHLLKVMSVMGTGQSFTNMWISISELVKNKNAKPRQIKQMLSEGVIAGTPETPSNIEFENSLLIAPKQKWLPYQLINIIEHIANKNNLSNEAIDYSKKSIEHIMPQKAKKEDWPFIEGKDEEYKRAINLIGNLANFNKSANSSLGNKSFIKKLEKYQKSNSPLITGENIGLQDIRETTIFTFETIQKRTKKLIKILINELR